MPIPNLHLRHLFPSTTPNPNIAFTPDDTLLHTTNGRIQVTDVKRGHTQTLPFEATRNLISVSYANNRLLTVDEASRAAIFTSPYIRPFARLSLRFQVLTCALSPCATYAAFLGVDKLEIWAIPKHSVPSFAAWEKYMNFSSGLLTSSTACLSWSRDSKRISVGLSSGVVILYTVDKKRTPGVHVKPLILHGHRTPVVITRFVGKKGLVTVSEDGALFCWRLRYNDEQGNEHDETIDVDKEASSTYQPQEYDFVKNNPSRNPKRRFFIVPVSAKLVSRHFVRQAGAKRVRSCDVADPFIVVGLSNGVFALYELPDAMTAEDDTLDKGLFELGERRAKKRARLAAAAAKEGTENETDEGENDDDGLDDDFKSRRIGFTDLTLLHTLSASGGAIARIAFNSSAAWIAMASAHSGQIVVWDWRGETHVLKQQGHTLTTEAVAFSPDGRAIATGSRDGRVKLWGTHTGFCVTTFSNHEAAVSALTFSANDVIISASYDGTVRAFDIRRYRNFRILVGPPPARQFACVAADSSGDLIAAGCVDTFEIIVWSLRTGMVVEVLNGHTGPVSSLSFRPVRGTLASSSWDKTVRVWDMYERKGSCEVLEHNKEVLNVTFRPDGKECASCTTAGEIILWNIESAEIVATIDGARDAAAGRSRDSRTKAQERGYFQTLTYTADGNFLLAGAASKHLCLFYVDSTTRPTLVRKIAVTKNQQFDGLLTRLNSKNLTDSGHDLIAHVDDDDAEYDPMGKGNSEQIGQARMARKKSLPGAPSEQDLQRKKLIQAEVKCVAVCRTGMNFAAVTQEGVLMYSSNNNTINNNHAMMTHLFDPLHLDSDITPKNALSALKNHRFLDAVVIALRLNERTVLDQVVQSIPHTMISLVVSQLPLTYFQTLVALLAHRLEHSPHLEFNLTWIKTLLLQQAPMLKADGVAATTAGVEITGVHNVMRAVHKACNLHAKRLVPVADSNEAMLRYLLSVSKRKEKRKDDVNGVAVIEEEEMED